MKILLTGSNGFVGKYLHESLSIANEVFTLNTRKSHFNINLANDKPELNRQFDIVIHSAGKAHSTSNSIYEKTIIFNVNVQGTKNLLDSLSKSLPKYFVFISSVSVYGLNYGENIDESHPLNAKDPYGVSKIEAEKLVLEWGKKNNVICTVLRLPLVIGTNPPGNLGAMIRAIKRGYYFNVAGGDVKKSMVLASDIPKYVILAAEVGGTYNLTDGVHPTFRELSKSISFRFKKSFVLNMPFFFAKILSLLGELIGENFPINSPKLVKITSTLTFNDSKARMAFGWKPSPVLEFFNFLK